MFTEKDQVQIEKMGASLAEVNTQLEQFRRGFPFLKVVKAATVGDGIRRLSPPEVEQYIDLYREAMPQLKVVKFVPASGAASRMFKDLFAAMEQHDEPLNEQMTEFFDRLSAFAFYEDLKATFGESGLDETLARGGHKQVLRHLLTDAGLAYGTLPKGLLKFHRYQDGARTPLEEHLVEATAYGAVSGGKAYLHFTVSPEHRDRFEALVEAVRSHYESRYKTQLDVAFSEQKMATNTLAVDMNDEPFREADGHLLFRPGGHGALIENLNEIEADLIFIKNVDNVVPDHLKDATIRYKQALAGVLLEARKQVQAYLARLSAPTNELIAELETYYRQTLCLLPPPAYESYDLQEKAAFFRGKLQRPMRVCGMVKNEGEPGGGPFWARNSDGSVSLQIAESAQIDTHDPGQSALMQNATHFNPVDLVCATRDVDGQPFDLRRFRDPETGFISKKSKDGRELKALELPGLWNGAMSDWNTMFVEVPIETFNPVKTVFDLLRPEHQG